MDFFNDFVFNNYMIFDDDALDVFLSTGDITQKTYDAAKKNRANFLAQQQSQQNSDNKINNENNKNQNQGTTE